MAGGGGGVGDPLESPVETHSILRCVFACVVVVFFSMVFLLGGGLNC